jgi:flagellar hook-basal body complex protein FliE
MTTDPVSFLPAQRPLELQPSAALPGASGAPADFSSWLTQSLDGVNQQLVQADHGLQSLATGEAQNLHQVMISLEQARVGIQLLAQVRNRLLDAYQEILRMQV